MGAGNKTRQKMRNKGYVMTWDAIIALIFVILVGISIISLEQMRSINVKKIGFLEIHSTGENSIGVLNKMGILEDIVIYWSENNTQLANDTATFYLEQFIPKTMGYRLTIGNDTVCENQRILEAEAVEKTGAGRFISGYGENKSGEFVARAWLLYNDTSTNKSFSIGNVSYGRGTMNSDGCNWTIEYINATNGNENVTLLIPSDYSDNRSCNYTGSSHSEPGGGDAINDAIYRLLSKIDWNPDDGILDKINDYDYNFTVMKFKVANISTPAFINTTDVNLILWMG